MHIALLHHAAPPVVGGVESVLAHHARLMAAAGHTVRVIAARGEAWAENIAFTRLPLVDSLHPDILAVKTELDAGRVPAAFDALTGQLAAELQTALADVDMLVAHNVCSLNKNLALTAALHRLYAAPGFPRLILWHHDLAWTTPRYQPELHAGYPWDLLRTDWPGATQVAVSVLRRRELADLLGLPPERIHVIPNGIEPAAFFKLEAQTRAFLQRIDWLNAAPFLLLPVRITPRKNLELALHTLAHLRNSYPRAALVITGPVGAHNPANHDYFARLKALRTQLGLDGALHFLAELSDTYLPDAVIADFFRLADALFMPSREEGFGIPLLEAAFSHLPVFCSDIPPLRALGGAAVHYFSPEADPAQVAALITRVLATDAAYQFAARARGQYSWEQIYRTHIAPLLQDCFLKTEE